jgi:uncharacterized CHY-type Zn-finger protein
MMTEFVTRSAEVAVPVGAIALDECSIRCKGRTAAKSYNPAKPDKYAIRLYAIVGSSSPYIFSCWDCGHGNRTSEVPGVQLYLNAFPDLRPIFTKRLVPSGIVPRDSSSALWAIMIAHVVRADNDIDAEKRFFCDNFYTRHKLAKAVYDVTDGKATITGTMKSTNMIMEDRVRVKVAMKLVEEKGRGTWLLLQVFERRTDGELFVAEKAGYVVLMDKRPVVFYSNDLNGDPNDGFEGKDSEHAMFCVKDLAIMHRWTGTECVARTQFLVPAMIAAYNTHMNGVDRLDQSRAVAPMRRKELRVSRSIFGFIIDSCVQNAYAVSKKLKNENRCWYDFKLELATFLMLSQGQQSPSLKKAGLLLKSGMNFDNLKTNKVANQDNILAGVDSITSNHFLMTTIDKVPTPCIVCQVCKPKNKKMTYRSTFTCFGCKKGFHVDCFNHFHCKQVTDLNGSVLAKFYQRLSHPKGEGLLRLSANRCTPDSLSNIVLPFMKNDKDRNDNEEDGRVAKRAKRSEDNEESG